MAMNMVLGTVFHFFKPWRQYSMWVKYSWIHCNLRKFTRGVFISDYSLDVLVFDLYDYDFLQIPSIGLWTPVLLKCVSVLPLHPSPRWTTQHLHLTSEEAAAWGWSHFPQVMKLGHVEIRCEPTFSAIRSASPSPTVPLSSGDRDSVHRREQSEWSQSLEPGASPGTQNWEKWETP